MGWHLVGKKYRHFCVLALVGEDLGLGHRINPPSAPTGAAAAANAARAARAASAASIL